MYYTKRKKNTTEKQENRKNPRRKHYGRTPQAYKLPGPGPQDRSPDLSEGHPPSPACLPLPRIPSGPSKFGPSEQSGQTRTPLDIIIPLTFHRLLATFYSAVQKFCHSCQDHIHSTISNAPLLLP